MSDRDALFDVHVHRAPTDASVQLLREMQEAALRNVIDQLTPTGNVMHGRVVQINNPWALHGRTLHILFDLNGKKYDLKRSLDPLWTARGENPHQVIFEAMAETIAAALMEAALKEQK